MAKEQKVDLADYVEVHERIEKFKGKHAEGSLQSTWSLHEINGQTVIVVKAWAYRDPEDQRPGIGLASEPVPGQTPFTKNSELMNAETSAWGRAIAALGFEVNRGVASAQEVRARGGSTKQRKPTKKQQDYLVNLLKDNGVSANLAEQVRAYAADELGSARTSKAIDQLVDKDNEGTTDKTVEALVAQAEKWSGQQNLADTADMSDGDD